MAESESVAVGDLLVAPVSAASTRTPVRLAEAGEDLFVGGYGQVRRANIKSGLNPTHTPLKTVERMDPRGIRLTQDTVSPNFSTGGHLYDAVRTLRSNPSSVDNFPTIRVVEHNGKLY